MKLLRSLFLFFFISINPVLAQEHVITIFVTAFLQDDVSQTEKAEEIFTTIVSYQDVKKYTSILNQLYNYLDKKPNQRLKTRILMLDIFGRTYYRLGINEYVYNKAREGIKIARQLKDDQLLAEWYALAGEINLDKGYLLYNLKSIQLQEKIGFQHFHFVQTRFYSISFALYRTGDYKESIGYGRKFLSIKSIESKQLNPIIHILQLDMLGASYKMLKMYDSTRYYYQKILDTLRKVDKISDPVELWEGIANGNIGQTLAMQKRYKEALPLIRQHLQVAIKYRSFNNVAIAQNALAQLYQDQGKISEAILNYEKAYYWAMVSNRLAEKIIATNGLAKNYGLLKQSDSAYKYNTLYYQHKDSLGSIINREKLAVINSQIAFDDSQSNLEAANQIIDRQLTTRNFIFFFIFLLATISLLVYKRKMLKQKTKVEKVQQQREQAHLEVVQAKKQIASFIEHIIEKEKLIEKLQSQNNNNAEIAQKLATYSLLTDAAWDQFRLEFAKANPMFFSLLKEKLIHSSPAEERLAALLYLQLSTNQIANSLGIGKESVGRSKRRLKQKLHLPAHVSLEDYLLQL